MVEKKLTEDGFFWMRDNVLSPEFCQQLIEKFEASPRKVPGAMSQGVVPEIKRSTDLFLSGDEEFAEEDRSFYTILNMSIREYMGQCKYRPWKNSLRDTGYNMQRTNPGEYFHWHSDYESSLSKKYVRVLTYLWYLNDVYGGGQTEFSNGIIVEPRVGRMIIFPSDLSVYHRGVPPVSETKYVVTGWFNQPLDP
jgi:hypothetical protein